MEITGDVRRELRNVIDSAYLFSTGLGREVEELLDSGEFEPLDADDAARQLTKAITLLRRTANDVGDANGQRSLDGNVEDIVQSVLDIRRRLALPPDSVASGSLSPQADQKRRVPLKARHGIKVGPVFPVPVFHGVRVPMNAGFVDTRDISLWEQNERLDIHVAQFRHNHGRGPTAEELLRIMLSQLKLPGIVAENPRDQFQIVQLAMSIAVNGVTKPPIMDLDGTLLDGNRRVAACHYILHNDEFSAEEKQHASEIFAWQLTEHADEDDRETVVVALNFPQELKVEWPHYVRARKVYRQWQRLRSPETRIPGGKKDLELRKSLAKMFAIGLDEVNRAIKMVDLAREFEHYHIDTRLRDEFEVSHHTNRYFQYFDELTRGERPGGVAYTLEQDETFKHLVFDLLYDGKFSQWAQIRQLKVVANQPEVRKQLEEARTTTDTETGQDEVDNALAVSRTLVAENRSYGGNQKIEVFTKWLESVPPKDLRDQIKPENLKRLLAALVLVEPLVVQILAKSDDPTGVSE